MTPCSDNLSIIGMITISVYVGGFRAHAALGRHIPYSGMITISVYIGGFRAHAALRRHIPYNWYDYYQCLCWWFPSSCRPPVLTSL